MFLSYAVTSLVQGGQVPDSLAAVTTALVAHSTSAAVATRANPFMWYVTRTAAVSAYVLLSVTVVWGLARSLVRTARFRSRLVLWLLDEVHPFLALLTAGFVIMHLVALALDPLIPFSVQNLLVPTGEPYRPFAVALGVLSFYGLGVVLVSSWLRSFIGYGLWRALHYGSVLVFAMVTLHGLLAGSDAGMDWMRSVYVLSTLAVGFLVMLRVLWPAPPPAPVSRSRRARQNRRQQGRQAQPWAQQRRPIR